MAAHTFAQKFDTFPFVSSYVREYPHPGVRIQDVKALSKAAREVFGTSHDLSKDGGKTYCQFWRKHAQVIDEDPMRLRVTDGFDHHKTCDMIERMSPFIGRAQDWNPEMVKTVICLLYKGYKVDQSLDTDIFRKTAMCVQKVKGAADPFGGDRKFIEYLQEKHPKDLADFVHFGQKERPSFIKEISHSEMELPIEESRVLSERSKKFLSKYVSIRLHPAFIQKKMDQFYPQLVRLIQANDPSKAAAYAHMYFVKIHPLGDYNGRVSRMLMNMILKSFSLPDIYFYSQEEYDREVDGALNDFTKFERFIAWKVYAFQGLTQLAKKHFPNDLQKQQREVADSGLLTGSLYLWNKDEEKFQWIYTSGNL